MQNSPSVMRAYSQHVEKCHHSQLKGNKMYSACEDENSVRRLFVMICMQDIKITQFDRNFQSCISL